jgi:hypothetical protein
LRGSFASPEVGSGEQLAVGGANLQGGVVERPVVARVVHLELARLGLQLRHPAASGGLHLWGPTAVRTADEGTALTPSLTRQAVPAVLRASLAGDQVARSRVLDGGVVAGDGRAASRLPGCPSLRREPAR